MCAMIASTPLSRSKNESGVSFTDTFCQPPPSGLSR